LLVILNSFPQIPKPALQAHLANPSYQWHKPKFAQRACNLAKKENKKPARKPIAIKRKEVSKKKKKE